MMYLLHQTRDGIPVGVFTETEHHYLEHEKHFEKYGVSVVEARGTNTDWEEWAEEMASKTPSPTAMWDVFEHIPAPLETVLLNARSATSFD